MTNASTNNDETGTSFDTRNEQYDDAIARPSMQISANNSQTLTSSYVPSRSSTPTKDLSSESIVPARTRATGSKRILFIFLCNFF